MQAAAHNEAPADRLAALRAELVTVRAARVQFAEWASECQDTSYEQSSEQARHAWASQSNRYRAQEFAQAARILGINTEIADLELQLKSAPAQAAPVVLCRDAVEGQDDTMNFRAEVAA